MTPYSRVNNLTIAEKVYNFRQSSARSLVERSFGIMTKKWGIMQKPFNFKLKNIEKIVYTLVNLHNFLITYELNNSAEEQSYNVDPNNELFRNIQNIDDNDEDDRDEEPIQIRDDFRRYFVSPAGAVPWKYKKVL